MRIVFVSYEYPPDTGFGGIGTYVYQISYVFSERAIDVHVVCGSFENSKTIEKNPHLTIHHIQCNDRNEFREKVTDTIKKIQANHSIDLIEAPDYGAESLFIKPSFPDIPLMVKFHTPAYLIKRLNDHYYNKRWYRKFKHAIKKYNHANDLEYRAAMQADILSSPSVSLGDIISNDWKIGREKILLSPYPYIPVKEMLDIPVGNSGKTVLYMGRLETRKGVYNLSKAIPLVLEKMPDANFILLGKNDRGPFRKESMKEVMIKELGEAASKVQFVDHVPLTEIPAYLAKSVVCVFPSLWENFPNVCLEAMSAARGIVASKEGGMKQMLETCDGGLIIDPHNVNEIANSVIHLLKNDEQRKNYGLRSREQVLGYHSGGLIDELVYQYESLSKNIRVSLSIQIP